MKGKRWTLKEVQKAQQLKAMGWSPDELAQEFDRTKCAIYNMFYELKHGELHPKEDKKCLQD